MLGRMKRWLAFIGGILATWAIRQLGFQFWPEPVVHAFLLGFWIAAMIFLFWMYYLDVVADEKKRDEAIREYQKAIDEANAR